MTKLESFPMADPIAMLPMTDPGWVDWVQGPTQTIRFLLLIGNSQSFQESMIYSQPCVINIYSENRKLQIILSSK